MSLASDRSADIAASRAAHGVTRPCPGAHGTCEREVRQGDPLRLTTPLLGHDAKRLPYSHATYHATAGDPVATDELLSLPVDPATRRGAPMAPAILEGATTRGGPATAGGGTARAGLWCGNAWTCGWPKVVVEREAAAAPHRAPPAAARPRAAAAGAGGAAA